MADFYQILRLPKSASSTEIRMAYKRLAMEYHPDRNAGDPQAEELFKLINEAYHTLADPVKKARYDARFEKTQSIDHRHEARRKWYHEWRRAQETGYKVDKEYFKIQGLTLLVFVVIAGFCFTIIHTVLYFRDHQKIGQKQANAESLRQVNSLFVAERFEDAFKLILSLKEKDPDEYRFHYTHDSLVNVLNTMAGEKFDQHDFANAITYYRVLQRYDSPASYETIQRIALCQYYLGNYKEALQAMKHLHNQNPDDLVLIFNIGVINLERLENFEEANHYLSIGKNLFRENLTRVYGEGFMFVMDPTDAPEIYYEILQARVRTSLKLDNLVEASRDGEWIMFLRPERSESWSLRAATNIKKRKFETVCSDLKKAQELGGKDLEKMIQQYCR